MGNEGRTVLTRGVTNEPGFTLIEVIVTLAIFSILVALAVPAMNRWISNVKVRSTADVLQNGLRMAQAESLRRSRQVAFSLTNSSSPKDSLTAVANGIYWSINTIPSMTDGTEVNQFIESGTLTTTTSGVTITGPAAICFNSMGRLVANAATGIAGASCTLPGGAPPVQSYQITLPSADRPLRLNVALGGQVHMCDPAKTLSSTDPDGC
jgi:type IV fimbrial biogenesis protein FimT